MRYKSILSLGDHCFCGYSDCAKCSEMSGKKKTDSLRDQGLATKQDLNRPIEDDR